MRKILLPLTVVALALPLCLVLAAPQETSIPKEVAKLKEEIEGLKAEGLPAGAIVAWYGKDGRIPDGWAVCDGARGTPDLREKFIMGVSDQADVGQDGGTSFLEEWRTGEHKLTIYQMPKHTHAADDVEHRLVNRSSDRGGLGGGGLGRKYTTADLKSRGGDRKHSHPMPEVDNRPAYVALLYIMKLPE